MHDHGNSLCPIYLQKEGQLLFPSLEHTNLLCVDADRHTFNLLKSEWFKKSGALQVIYLVLEHKEVLLYLSSVITLFKRLPILYFITSYSNHSLTNCILVLNIYFKELQLHIPSGYTGRELLMHSHSSFYHFLG